MDQPPNNLPAKRKQAGLTQVALAEIVGTYQANVARYEAGASEPRARMAVRIARAVESTVEAIWPDEQQEASAT